MVYYNLNGLQIMWSSPIRAERITMKINMNETLYAGCVFLGGTCANSTWRSELIEKLHANVPYFDPQVAKLTQRVKMRASRWQDSMSLSLPEMLSEHTLAGRFMKKQRKTLQD